MIAKAFAIYMGQSKPGAVHPSHRRPVDSKPVRRSK